MGDENRVITLADGVDDRVIDSDELNELQDRLVCYRALSEEEGALPASFGGGLWLYGQLTLAPSSENAFDLRTDYWNDGGILGHRDHELLVFAAYNTDSDYMPNGSKHGPAGLLDIQWQDFNLKSAAAPWTPFAGAPDITVTMDADNRNINVDNAHVGTTYYVYLLVFASKSIDETETGTYRKKSMAYYGRVSSEMITRMQDCAVMLQEANQEEGALPATFLGGTWAFGEFSINDTVDKLLDDEVDWRNRMMLGFGSSVANADRLPSGNSHTPANIANADVTYHCTKAGDVIGGPFTLSWTPIAGVSVYADSVAGELYCSNNSGAPVYMYFTLMYTAPIV